jgi:hypothetical protein
VAGGAAITFLLWVDPVMQEIAELNIAVRSVVIPLENIGGSKTTRKNGTHQIINAVIVDTRIQNIAKGYWQEKPQIMQLCRQKKKLRGI